MFEVHQPYRLARRITRRLAEKVALKGKVDHADLEEIYFDQTLNREVFERVARRCYLPANAIILQQIDFFKNQGKNFKVSYSVSGVLLEQAERWMPSLLESFRQLASTGMVEFLDQTYFHSLSFLIAEEEFIDQIRMHRELLKSYLGVSPISVENTEFIYNNYIAKIFDKLGYKVVLTEGVEKILMWRSPNYVYKAKGLNLRVLMRNYRLSDDIGFRFASRWWSEYPLTADKYSAWLAATPGDVILIAIDYETFGEHFPAETGIFEFLRWLPGEILKWEHLTTSTPSEVVERVPPRDEIDVPESDTISWADLERDLTAWTGNFMQDYALDRLRDLWLQVKATRDENLLRLWRLLSISDHFYYMSTKGGGPGDVHSYFSPYKSPFQAYMIYSDVLADLEYRTLQRLEQDEDSRYRWVWMKRVDAGKEFMFYLDVGKPLNLVAWNVFSFIDALERAPLESVVFHQTRGDFSRWLSFSVGEKNLGEKLEKVKIDKEDDLKGRILEILYERRKSLFGF
ncbi:MAG: alpha-amylase [Infirmifilum uzonense]|jgi:alpha-amylase|uniref:alpha-amylase n=1 Tax=Infirmifilum uzonense TaxID=1550241 RepID=UPI002356AC13